MASANETPSPNPATVTTDVLPPPEIKQVADHLIIDGQRVDVAVMSDFPDSGPVLILGDGTVESGQITSDGTVATDKSLGRAPLSPDTVNACGDRYGWTAAGDGNYHLSIYGCSLIGTSSSFQAGYEIGIDGANYGGACGMALGYHLVPASGGGYVYSAFWTGLGCKNPGQSITGAVPWGNVAASKRVNMMSSSAPIGSSGWFI
ncbi:MAG: hypothetical protein JSS74_14880 [Actinobacteria bacterium]|nr:hypothetical protein [Actinomycetota bacterium]